MTHRPSVPLDEDELATGCLGRYHGTCQLSGGETIAAPSQIEYENGARFPARRDKKMQDEGTSGVVDALAAVDAGQACASEHLLPLVYDYLRNVAKSMMRGRAAGRTLQPTALVHEAFLRIAGSANVTWSHRYHFVSAAALAMRHILIEQARRQMTLKRGAKMARVDMDPISIEAPHKPEEVLALEEVLTRLEARDPRKGQIVNLRYFAGMTVPEVAAALDVSVGTVERDWRYIKSWIAAELSEGQLRGPTAP